MGVGTVVISSTQRQNNCSFICIVVVFKCRICSYIMIALIRTRNRSSMGVGTVVISIAQRQRNCSFNICIFLFKVEISPL